MKSSKFSEAEVAEQPVVQFKSPSWPSVVLVCRECSQRSSGPKKLKSKAVASALKANLRDARPRPRLVMTSCLGLCPKKAIAVAVAGGAVGTQIAAVQTLAQLARMTWARSASLKPFDLKADSLRADEK